jgi:hypothetical protein
LPLNHYSQFTQYLPGLAVALTHLRLVTISNERAKAGLLPGIGRMVGNVMSRKSFALAIVIVFLLVGLVGATGFVLVRHEPSFYKHCVVADGPARERLADEVDSELANRLAAGILNESAWEVNLREDQLNAFLSEPRVLKKYTVEENPFPEGVSDPRLSLDQDCLRFGFRYGVGRFSTVISLELRAWLAAQDPNVLAIEFVSLHAGAIPISAQWLLERVAESARSLKIDVNYFRYNKHPILVLRFQADRNNPTFQLQQVKLVGQTKEAQGFIHIAGDKPKG